MFKNFSKKNKENNLIFVKIERQKRFIFGQMYLKKTKRKRTNGKFLCAILKVPINFKFCFTYSTKMQFKRELSFQDHFFDFEKQ